MTTHVLNAKIRKSLCENVIEGDLAITLEQALDPNSDMHFDCVGCHKVLTDNSKHTPVEE